MGLAEVSMPERMTDAVAALDLNHRRELQPFLRWHRVLYWFRPARMEAVFPSSLRHPHDVESKAWSQSDPGLRQDGTHWVGGSLTAQMSLDCIGGADSLKVSSGVPHDAPELSQTNAEIEATQSRLQGATNPYLPLLQAFRRARDSPTPPSHV